MNSIPPNPGTGTVGTEPEPFDASTLSASLTCTVLQTSLAWYRDVLGFTVVRTFDRAGTLFAVSLRAGAVPILLTQDDGAKGSDRVKGEGISLQLTTAQNIDELASKVRERGGTLASEPADVMGARVFRLRDPDGFKLVISSLR
jgi:catechol 2,3-dioxygenase-like lactoylglutathione lyase family enzyme